MNLEDKSTRTVTDDATLIDDFAALGINMEGRNEDVDRRWSSEELLSTCDALVRSSLPSYSMKGETRSPVEVKVASSDPNLISDIGQTELFRRSWDSNHSCPVECRASSASSSSSFNSCESALEKCVLEMHEGSPLIFHSCSSLRVVREGTRVNSSDRSSPQEAEFTLELGGCPNEIDIGSDSQLVRERGRALDDSKTSDSVPLNHEFEPDLPPIRFADSVGDEKAINERLNKADVKCLRFPEYEKGIDTGVENVFPSLIVPSSTAAVGAKDAKAFDVSRDLFCLPSEREIQNNFCGVFSSGEIKSGKYENKISKEDRDANSFGSATNEVEKNNLSREFGVCEGNSENVEDDGMENLLKRRKVTPEGGVRNVELDVPPSGTLPFKSDIMDITYVNYLKKELIPRSSQDSEHSDESSYCSDISDGTYYTVPSELTDHEVKVTFDPVETGSRKVSGKRMSNLFHAVPVFVKDEHESLPCVLDYVGDQIPSSISSGNANKSLENVNIRSAVSRALKIKPSNDCQSFLSIGTASDFVVSNEFGATEVAVGLQREYSDKKSVGEVQFSIRGTLRSYPIYRLNADFKNLPGYFTWELRLAWRGSDWNLSVDDNGWPVINYGEVMAECELKHDESQKQSTSKLYGFTIISDENIRVKNLVPLFNGKDLNDWNKVERRSSICTSVALRAKNVVTGNKKHRNSAFCDMKMYRNAQQFVPIYENESSVNGNTDDHLQLCSVILDSSALNEVPTKDTDGEAKQNENFFDDGTTVDTLKPASVLRSNSDSRIKFENQENTAASRSISLQGYEAENASNLSNFKGVTMDNLPSSEIQAAAFLSSFLEQSMHPERVPFRDRNTEKTLSGNECSFENLSSVDPSVNYLPNCSQTNVSDPRNITTINISPPSNIYSPSYPENMECGIKDKNVLISPDCRVSSAVHSKCSTSSYEPFIYPKLDLTTTGSVNVHLEPQSTCSNLYMPTSLASFFVTSGNSQVPASTSITYATADIKLNNMSNHMSVSPSLETRCYVTQATPPTKMSILPVLQSSVTTEGTLALSSKEHSPAKYNFVNTAIDEVVPQPSIVPNADNFCENKAEFSQKQNLDVSSLKEDRGSVLKKRAVNVAKQQGALPPRHTYSTKFPMDIICQGRLQEVKKKTTPPAEFSNTSVEENRFRRKRISSVGQVKPLTSYLKENYPTTRSKSAGRMDFGSTQLPASRSSSEYKGEKNYSKPLDRNSILSEVEEDVFSTPAVSMDEVSKADDDTFFSCKDHIVDASVQIEDSGGIGSLSKECSDTIPAVKHLDSLGSFTKENKYINSKDIVGTLGSVKNIIPTPFKVKDVDSAYSYSTTCDNSLSSKASNLLPKSIASEKLEANGERVHETASSHSSVVNLPQNRTAGNKNMNNDIFATFVDSFIDVLFDMKILLPLVKDRCNRLSTRSKDRIRPARKKDISKTAVAEKEFKQGKDLGQNYIQDVSLSTGVELHKCQTTADQRMSEGLSIGKAKNVTVGEILPQMVCLRTLPPDNKSKSDNLLDNINKIEDTSISSCVDTSVTSCASSFQNGAGLIFDQSKNVATYSRTHRSPESNSKTTISIGLCTPCIVSVENPIVGRIPYINNAPTSKSPDTSVGTASQKSFIKLADKNYVTCSNSSDAFERDFIPEPTFRTSISPESSRLRTNASPNKTAIAVSTKRSFSKSPERTGLVISTERSVSRSPEKTVRITREISSKSPDKLSANMLTEETGIKLAAKRSFSKSPERTGLTISTRGNVNRSFEKVNVENFPENTILENLEQIGVCKSQEIGSSLKMSYRPLGNNRLELIHDAPEIHLPTPALIEYMNASAADEEISEGKVHDSFPSLEEKPGSREELDTVRSVMEFSHYKVVDLDESDDAPITDSTGLNITLKSELELKLDPDHKSELELKLDPDHKSELELSKNSNLSPESELKTNQSLKSDLNIDADIFASKDKNIDADIFTSKDKNIDADIFTSKDKNIDADIFTSKDKNIDADIFTSKDKNIDADIFTSKDKNIDADIFTSKDKNIDADIFTSKDKGNNIRNIKRDLKPSNEYDDKEQQVDTTGNPLSQISLPETTKPLSFVVEEIIDFIDENFTSTNRGKEDRFSPSTVPPLSATLSFPIKRDVRGSSHLAGRSTERDKKSFDVKTSPTRPFGNEEQKSEFFSVRAEILGDRITYSNGTAASTPAVPVVAPLRSEDESQLTQERRQAPLRSEDESQLTQERRQAPLRSEDESQLTQERRQTPLRSEDESQSTQERRQINVEALTSSSSVAGSALDWKGDNRGPVARRDLFPLEDEDVTPQWHALLEVNPPDSDDDDRTGFESDDDFESMDAEMRRLEEKLKKFERELGVMSSGEDIDLPTDATNNDTAKSSRQENLKVPRLRQEDIDVLKTFSLPDVYPPVDILKTKHLSLMTKEEDLLDEDDDEREINHAGSESGNSSQLLFIKPLRKLKPGERRCRSLNLQKLSSKKGSKCTNSKYSNFNSILINTTTQKPDPEDRELEASLPIEYEPSGRSADSSEEQRFRDEQIPPVEVRYIDDDRGPSEEEEEDSSTINVESGSTDFRYCSFDCLVGEDSCDGYLWRNSGSEISVFDFDGLDELQEVYQVTEHCLFFIFEDDNDDKVEGTSDTCSSSVVERGTFLLPLSKEISKVHDNDESGYPSPDRLIDKDFGSSCKRKRDGSLVSAFKNSFRKAAKYLGPNPFHNRGKEEEELEDYFAKNLLPSPLYDDIDEYASGKYSVSNAKVVNDPTDAEESPSSGEYYACPAVCVMTSDEESLRKNQTVDVIDNSPSELLKKHVILEGNLLPSFDNSSTEAQVPVHDHVGTNGEPTSLKGNSVPAKVPPPVPPRRSHLISELAEKTVKIAEGLKTYCLEEDLVSAKPAIISSVDASGNVTHKPTSLRQIKRKQQERIETQKIEEALESTDCTFCVGVPAFYRGRTDQHAGNHNRHPSPHPRVLPERRTWPPRK